MNTSVIPTLIVNIRNLKMLVKDTLVLKSSFVCRLIPKFFVFFKNMTPKRALIKLRMINLITKFELRDQYSINTIKKSSLNTKEYIHISKQILIIEP